MTYLRRQEEILSALLDKEKQANARLQSESLTARRMADAAEAQMASQAERARQSARTEEDHAALMHKVEQLNWLRDSNEKLRCALLTPSWKLKQGACRDAPGPADINAGSSKGNSQSSD